MSESPTPLSPAVFHVLLALSKAPLHGYAVMREAEATSGQTFGPGTVYGSLARLQEAGWVNVVAATSPDARRGRSFELTDAGREALAAEARRITNLAQLDQVRSILAAGGSA